MNPTKYYNIKYKNKLIVKLHKEYGILSNNISSHEIRILICLLIKNNEFSNLKNVLEIIFAYDNRFILELLLLYKNKVTISKENLNKILLREEILDLYINFNLKNNNYIYKTSHINETTTPLHIACYYNYFEILKLFLNYGADINIKNSDKENLLTFLSYNGRIDEMIKLLINNKIDINSTDINGNNPLHIICRRGYIDQLNIFKYMIEQGLDINKQNNIGNTPLIESCYENTNSDFIIELINYGANVNLVNNKGESAFLVACKKCNYYTALRLFKNGANPYIKDNENNSAIYILTKYLCTDSDCIYGLKLLDFLIELGFNINEVNKNNETLLMEVCRHDDWFVVSHFIEKGANIYMKDKNGNTALSIAQSLRNDEVSNYLIEHGALWKFCNYSKNK